MVHRLMVVPSHVHVDLHRESRRLANLMRAQGLKVIVFEPISDHNDSEAKISFTIKAFEHEFSRGRWYEVLQQIEETYQKIATSSVDVVLINGLSFCVDRPYVGRLNGKIARAFDAHVALATDLVHFDEHANIILRSYGDLKLAIASHIDEAWIKNWMADTYSRRVTPSLFIYHLMKKAKKANRRIILPESGDLRILQAAMSCTEQGLARCILMGKSTEIHQMAKAHGITLSDQIEIIEPTSARMEQYVKPMVALRKEKGLTAEQARVQLQNPMTLATMMLQQGEVDGIVSGATHSTLDTIRPAFQLIKTAPDANLVSSVFFMCLSTRVLVFGDCAINMNPCAERLADIAIHSADTAAEFGIMPKVAMISYSSGDSGVGADVDKVKEATALAKKRRPDLLIDGPLQYDAAIDPQVAAVKMPNSPVAGDATVFVFPNLDTGNAVYKAIQRTTHILCIGPMLQGLNKPVNDLSRGCSVKDIVFTIAVTAIQADRH